MTMSSALAPAPQIASVPPVPPRQVRPTAQPAHSAKRDVWREVKRHRHFYWFVAPFFVLFAVWALRGLRSAEAAG